MLIKKASPNEWEQAMEVAWRTFLKFEAPIYKSEGTEHFLELISDEKLFKMFLNGDYIVYVAKEGDRVIGIASMRAGFHISLLFVDESFHKKGIGRELLRALQKELNARGQIKMTVNAAPYAIGFYERCGFLRVGDILEADGITFQPMECLVKI